MDKAKKNLVSVSGGITSGDSKHSISPSEVQAFIDFINSSIDSEDEDLKGILPLTDHASLFEAISRGVILGKLINKSFENTVDISKLNLNPKNTFEQNENHDQCINGAKAIGCQVVNIGGNDLIQKKEYLIMGLIWQVIKMSILKNIAMNPDLQKLGDESMKDLPPEVILMHWFNFHLKRAQHNRVIKNFSNDITDSENYAILMNRIAPDKVSLQDVEKILREKDLEKRAGILLEYADLMGCKKFVTPKDIVEGNDRLNLAFVATLFAAYPALGPTDLDLAREKIQTLEMKVSQADQIKVEYESLKKDFEELSQLSEKSKSENQALSQELQKLKDEKQAIQDQLSSELSALKQEKLDMEANLTGQLNSVLTALKKERAEMEQNLTSEINNLKEEKQKLETTVASQSETIKTHEDTIKTHEETIKSQSDTIKTQSETITSLNDEIAQLKAKIEELENRIKELQDEMDRMQKEANDMISDLELEKNGLLAELKILKEQMELSLSAAQKDNMEALAKAEREKAEMLAKAEREKQEALMRAESEREMELEKLKGLLSNSQREGYLLKMNDTGIMKSWKKFWFILKDNMLVWYKDNKNLSGQKPQGVVYVESCRFYKLEEKSIKKPHAFEITNESVKVKLAAANEEEAKLWMGDIKEAKKKKLGVLSQARDQKDDE